MTQLDRLAPADETFLAPLRAQLPQAVFRPLSPTYLSEPRGRFHGQAGAVLAPETVEQTALIIRHAALSGVGVVPFGGGSGLVGGQVLVDGPAPVILSSERMARVRAIYPEENVIVAEAGVILADLQAAAARADRLFPLSLAAEGTARIGGCLATNAGGVNMLRYGNARDLCLGVEAVLADGSIHHGATRLRKDNTGYDLRHLLIGSEGTLGVITAASLRLFPRPAARATALFVVADPDAALGLLARAGARFGSDINAFELIAQMGLLFLRDHLPDIRQPFDAPPDWMVLVEVSQGAGQDPQGGLEALFEEALDAGLVLDGVMAQSETQRRDLWHLRESIPLANRAVGAISSQDISLPLSAQAAFIAEGLARLARLGDFRVNCFGHLGDGNLHYNVFPPAGAKAADFTGQRTQIKTCLHDLVHEMGGSVSAEHGIGRLKVDDLIRYGDPAKLAAMRAIKQALDPRGIMNPGAVVVPDRR